MNIVVRLYVELVEFQIACACSVVLGHPVLRLVHVSLLIGDGIQTVIDVVAGARQVLTKLSGAAEWPSFLQHVRSVAYLTIARLVNNFAVIVDDLCDNTKMIISNCITINRTLYLLASLS